MTAFKAAEMDQLRVEIEDRLEQPARVAEELRLRLGLRDRRALRAAGIAAAVRRQRARASWTNDDNHHFLRRRSIRAKLREAIRARTDRRAHGGPGARLCANQPGDSAGGRRRRFRRVLPAERSRLPAGRTNRAGQPRAGRRPPGADLRTDVPRYRVFRRGVPRSRRADRHPPICGATISSAFCSAARSRSRRRSKRPACAAPHVERRPQRADVSHQRPLPAGRAASPGRWS